MTNFFGKNDLKSTKYFFEERADYKLTAYQERNGLGPDQVRNLNFTENAMYGCIDHRMDTVYPLEQNMKFLNSKAAQDNSPRAIDFVADAFNSVVEIFNQACHTNIIPIDDPYLSQIRAVRAFQAPLEAYADYIETLMDQYLGEYIVTLNKRRDILNLRQYIDNLYIFIKNRKQFTPLTFTSWQRSRLSSIFTSGLAIDIAGLAIDDDRIKEQLFLNNPIYPFFLNVCKANGFLIPHNTPWIMVADIMSPALLKYTVPYLIRSTTDIFTYRFENAYKRDIDLLKDLIFSYYNRFANNFEVEKQVDCNCNNKTISILFDRDPMSRESFDKYYNDKDWLKLYISIRNIEEFQPFSDKKMRNMYLKAKNNNFFIDNLQKIGYINEEYRKNYRKRFGGFNKVRERYKMKKSENKIPVVAGQTQQITTTVDPAHLPPLQPNTSRTESPETEEPPEN